MTLRAVDCQSFGGGFTLGAVQAGFELVGKREMSKFGVANCEANRHLLGRNWTSQIAPDPANWEPVQADFVFGNPPCSGFSPLSRSDFRGSNSPINHCMWAFVGFAARCNAQVAVFESVQQAYSGGLDLMQGLHNQLERWTNQQWTLYHVLHNAYGVGGSSIRRRYFWVASRIPFGVEHYDLKRVPVLDDVIGDLMNMPQTWSPQPYRWKPSWWVRGRRNRTGIFDGHMTVDTPATRRAFELIQSPLGVEWGYRENLAMVARRYYEKNGRLPASWHNADRIVAKDFNMGYNQMIRWHPQRAGRVITGAALDLVLHPHEDRTITHREAARIVGFPDTWRIEPLADVGGVRMTWGKGIHVECGRWIATQVHAALNGQPRSDQGKQVGEREYVIDHTSAYTRLSAER